MIKTEKQRKKEKGASEPLMFGPWIIWVPKIHFRSKRLLKLSKLVQNTS